MSSHLKKCHREKCLEKIRGKARRPAKRKSAEPGKLSAKARAHFRAAEANGLFSYTIGGDVLAFEAYEDELEKFPELRPFVHEHHVAIDTGTWTLKPMPGASAGAEDPDDANTAHNLELYAMNTGELYDAKKDVIRGLLRKWKGGAYDPDEAERRWVSWLNKAARRYGREFGLPDRKNGVGPFSRSVVDQAARSMRQWFEATAPTGEHDYLLR